MVCPHDVFLSRIFFKVYVVLKDYLLILITANTTGMNRLRTSVCFKSSFLLYCWKCIRIFHSRIQCSQEIRDANGPADCDEDNDNLTPLLRKLWSFLVAVEVKFRTYWIRLGVRLHISAVLCCRDTSASTGRDSEEEKLCMSRLAQPGRSAASHVNDWNTYSASLTTMLATFKHRHEQWHHREHVGSTESTHCKHSEEQGLCKKKIVMTLTSCKLLRCT